MGQLDLRVKRPVRPCDAAEVAALPNLGAACRYAADQCGLQDKSICYETGVDPGVWTRIKSGPDGANPANPSGEFLLRLMDLTGCEAPLIWLLTRRNYDPASLRQSETELQRRAREAEDRAAAAELKLAMGLDLLRQLRVAA